MHKEVKKYLDEHKYLFKHELENGYVLVVALNEDIWESQPFVLHAKPEDVDFFGENKEEAIETLKNVLYKSWGWGWPFVLVDVTGGNGEPLRFENPEQVKDNVIDKVYKCFEKDTPQNKETLEEFYRTIQKKGGYMRTNFGWNDFDKYVEYATYLASGDSLEYYYPHWNEEHNVVDLLPWGGGFVGNVEDYIEDIIKHDKDLISEQDAINIRNRFK